MQKIPHAAVQQSLCAPATKDHILEPVLHVQQQKPPQWKAQASQLESSLCSLQLEKAHV